MLLSFYYLAAKRNEIFQLKWTDLGFVNDQVCLWTQKREGSDREPDWLPMTPDLKNALLSWREERLSQRNVDEEHVFVCLEKTPFCEDYYGKPFMVRQHFMKKLCEKVKIERFGFHPVRHLVATIRYHKGHNLSKIQAILRHKNPPQRKSIYEILVLNTLGKPLRKA